MRKSIRSGVCAFLLGGGAVACELAADLGPTRTLAPPDAPEGGPFVDDAGWTTIDVAPTDAGEEWIQGGPPDGADEAETGPLSVQASGVAVGPTHACAIVSLGPSDTPQVRCWGSNGSGEVGALQRPWSPPVRVDIPMGVQVQALALAAGYSFALTSTDVISYVYAWGNVPSDPLVQREPSSWQYEPSLMDYGGTRIAGAVSVAIGADGGCFVQSSQPAQCWGAYVYGSSNVSDAGSVVYDPFDSVAVGRTHACGKAMHNGVYEVECWGANDHGQAGVVDGGARITDPTALGLAAGGRQVAQVAVGKDTSCARLDDGSVYCWGANDRGQVGAADAGRDIFTPTHVALPMTVAGKEMAIDVAVGDSHACALLSSGNVWCWGDDTVAQLGNGPTSTPQRPVAVRVSMATRLSAQGIAAGGRTTCARDQSLQVRCWGANDLGQAGRPATDAGTAYLPYATLVAF